MTLKRIMAKVDVASQSQDASGIQRRARVQVLGEDDGSWGGPDCLNFALDTEEEYRIFAERVGKTVCLAVEDA